MQIINSKIINGRVTRLGYYYDTIPLLVISIPKQQADGLPVVEGERTELSLDIHGETYQAGIRTTSRATVVNICPDLLDPAGRQIRLADQLLRNNIQQKATVRLSWDEHAGTITLQPNG